MRDANSSQVQVAVLLELRTPSSADGAARRAVQLVGSSVSSSHSLSLCWRFHRLTNGFVPLVWPSATIRVWLWQATLKRRPRRWRVRIGAEPTHKERDREQLRDTGAWQAQTQAFECITDTAHRHTYIHTHTYTHTHIHTHTHRYIDTMKLFTSAA